MQAIRTSPPCMPHPLPLHPIAVRFRLRPQLLTRR